MGLFSSVQHTYDKTSELGIETSILSSFVPTPTAPSSWKINYLHD